MANENKDKKGIKLDETTLEDVSSDLYNFTFDEDDEEKQRDFYEYDESDLNDFAPIGSVDNEYYTPFNRKHNDNNDLDVTRSHKNPFDKFKKEGSKEKVEEKEIVSNKTNTSKFEEKLDIDRKISDKIISIFNDDESKLKNQDEITIFEDKQKDDVIVDLDEAKIKSLMESAFYVYGHEGLSLSDLRRLTLAPISTIKKILKDWMDDLEKDKTRGIAIKNFGEKYKFFTKETNREELSRLITIKYRNPLSQKVMETLAIIAYNQPCTKAIIEDIRGKDPTQTIQKLIDLGLVVEAGRASGPGRPLLFTVTSKFYDIFGIKNLSDLPTINLDQPFQDDDVSFFDTTRFND